MIPARPARSAGALAVTVALVGVAVSLGAGTLVATGQRGTAGSLLDRRVDLISQAVAAQTRRYVDTLETVAASLGALDPLTARHFALATGSLPRMRLPGATSVAFLVPAGDGEVAAVQQTWRSRGAAGLVLVPRGTGHEHIFGVFVRSLDGRPVLTGVDVTQLSAPAAALAEARRAGTVAVSDTYQFLRDRILPPDRRQNSFALAAPVYGPGGAFRGWVVLGLHGQDFAGETLGRAAQGLVDVSLLATNADGAQVAVSHLASPAPGRRDLHRAADLALANRHWQLRIDAAAAALPGASSGLAAAVAAAGTALSLLLALLVYVLATGRARARAQVRTATAELRAAEAQARQHAGLLESILDSIGDGVVVVDERGRFLVSNPAARRLLGLDVDAESAAAASGGWADGGPPARFGLYAPDGVTPFPHERLPLVRAVAGEPSEQVPMIIRNGGDPEGVHISVSARPLADGAGRPGAVAVFRDVTLAVRHEARLAEELTARQATEAELRVRERELQAFAGVVAHDLRSPLTAVAGFAELLRDDLAGDPGGAANIPLLDRIAAGTSRMQRLIDDLLGYATAERAPLCAGWLDLRALVDEVVAGRLDDHRATADAPTPDIYVGPLPAVHADPALLRQVIDNLLGNAIRFTPPGQAARIDISAAAERDGWTRIDVADRGIGIPEGEHEAVFAGFHRAHSDASRAGTGLGLAISRRIIDRHGGTIRAADNPGGGTRVHFTLPTAPVLAEHRLEHGAEHPAERATAS